MSSRSSGWPQFGLLLLVYELVGLGRIPPVTLASIGLQVGLFLRVLAPYLGNWTLWTSSIVCLNAKSIMQHDQLYRIFTAPLFHGSDLHLYYNMISFAMKGIHLERRHGSLRFIVMLLFMTGLTGLIYVGLCVMASEYFNDASYLNQCAIGFSGVVFALKVLTNESDGNFGLFTVPKKLAIWAELLIIQILVPNSSIIGHASGIIAGIIVAYLIPITLYFPIKLLNESPLTLITGATLTAFHMEWVKRPWKTKAFWSSGTPLVCLSSNAVFVKGEYFRLISGPLEHAGNVHFVICLFSTLLKLYQLEQKHSFGKVMTMFMSSIVISSFAYICLQTHDCVQGLSGANFALKSLTLLSGTSNFPLLLFELIELLILLEERTLIYHVSGLVTGLFIWIFYARPDPFPGQGIPLGSSRPSTRSWGYSHYTDAQFRRVVDLEEIDQDSTR